MTAAPDYLGTLRGALSDWLYDPRYTTAPYEAQAAHADAIEAALAECKREGLGDVADNLSRGHGWEDTAACWVWRLPGWGDLVSRFADFKISIPSFFGALFAPRVFECVWICGKIRLDWWSIAQDEDCTPSEQWTVIGHGMQHLSLKSPEGLALLDTARPKVTP